MYTCVYPMSHTIIRILIFAIVVVIYFPLFIRFRRFPL